MLANFVDRANVRVVEGGRGTSLATESFQRLRIARQIVRKELQGNESTKLGVLGFINDTHTAASEFLDHWTG